MKFPLPEKLFPPLPLEMADVVEAKLAAIAEDLVARRIREYDVHLYDRKSFIDMRYWNLLKKRENISVFQRKNSPPATTHSSQSLVSDDSKSYLLGLGSVVGTLEDAIFGMLGTTTTAMKVRTSYIGDHLVDAAVLRTIVEPTVEEPLRFVGVKWMVKKPVFKRLVRHRDFVFLESIGIRTNSKGERIGYHLLHSVDLPLFPSFQSLDIVRAKLSFCYLYRQRDASTIDCFLRGQVDPNGKIPAKLVALSGAEGLISCWRSIRSAEMKKITHFLRLQTSKRARTETTTSTIDASSSKRSTHCTLCTDGFSFFTSAHVCQICSERFCSKCVVERTVSFLVDGSIDRIVRRSMEFCTTCMLEVKRTSALQVAAEQLQEEEQHHYAPALSWEADAVWNNSGRTTASSAAHLESSMASWSGSVCSSQGSVHEGTRNRIMKFPVKESPFPQAELSRNLEQRLRHEADELVDRYMHAYDVHLYENGGVADLCDWSLIKKREGISMYTHRRSKRDLAKDDSNLYLLGLGNIAGRLEDTVYGVFASTTEAMHVRTSYLQVDLSDSALLHTLAGPSPDDPLRFMGIKWMVKKPRWQGIVRHRDFVMIESIGITSNSRGERIGYHLFKSVDLPCYPELKQSNIVRGRLSVCYLYRQRNKGCVDVYLRGRADAMGNVPTSIVATSAADVFISCWRSVRCAELNKLAYLFQQNTRQRVERASCQSSSAVSIRSGLTARGTVGMNDEVIQRCTLCLTQFGVWGGKKQCQLCDEMHCSRCTISRKISFLVNSKTVIRKKIAACTACMVKVKSLNPLDIARDHVNHHANTGFPSTVLGDAHSTAFPSVLAPPRVTMNFPLNDKYFPTVELEDVDAKSYRRLAREIVKKTLDQEMHYRYERKQQLDNNKWKFLKSKDRLRVYKRAATTPTANEIPMLLAVGAIEGTLEDAIYGVHHKNTEEMRTTTSFLNSNTLDAAVLATIESGTNEDPFHFLGLKWRITRTPGGTLISNRDVCVLDHMGIGVDSHGNRYGYHMMKSVDIPWCPAFQDKSIIRAQTMLCCIYRQLSPGVVAAYIKGVFNLGGDLIDYIAYNTAADTLLAIARAVDCAEAKRLTVMVQESNESTPMLQSSRSMSTHGIRSTSLDKGSHKRLSNNCCALCDKKTGLSSFVSTWDHCRICSRYVCSKCHVTKTIFAQPKNIKVACCKICILEAKNVRMDPRKPFPFVILAP
ncbi:TPA: hypothetical protein N0F65_004334 [Lagenidium giganteum]|uniref:FYVE-type domain-containing protein n=1 Tax=Lagenidium giganteum TaxID=4803 RepID=A0AAV2YPM7_9STRA|nr:TPA: hypothetical protein N0F65_004334 [Lagenidium giganteum]